jgi:hypothetical protein
MSINPQFIYCYATGKPIAKIDDDSWLLILGSLIHLDPEEQADELEVRALTSMRPSVLWNSITRESIEYVRTAAPRELLAWLMNRMYAPIEHSKAKPLTFESRLAALRFRTELWQIIESAPFAPDQLEQLVMILLELDTAFNLTRLVKPNNVQSAWSTNINELIQTLATWRDKLTAEQIKLAREARISDQWWRAGNQHTSKAFVAATLNTKPVTRAAVKKAEKVKEKSLFDSIAAAILGEGGVEPIADQIAKPVAWAPVKRDSEAAAIAAIRPRNVISFKRKAS